MQFSEKDFYLAEFRFRTLGIALPGSIDGLETLDFVLDEFARNDTRVVLLSSDPGLLGRYARGAVLSAAEPRWAGKLWRALRSNPCASLVVEPGPDLADRCREIALQLGLLKLVWIDDEGGLGRQGELRHSFMDLVQLDALIADQAQCHQAMGAKPERLALLPQIREMVACGVPTVNLCSLAGLADELFTYAGSGTLFTRERYTDVRSLALDEFDAAHDLISRGVQEGYLVARSDEELEWVLSNAFGVFVEGRYLAGIGALLPTARGDEGEIVSLYTLTRFVGGGVGEHLIRFALELARRRGFGAVFACTTSPRVESFFERYGFHAVSPEALPAEKWRDYSDERRERVRCLRRETSPG